MSKKRVHELAKELNTTSKKILDIVHSMGVEASNHMAGLDDNVISKVKGRLHKLKQNNRPNDDKKMNIEKSKPISIEKETSARGMRDRKDKNKKAYKPTQDEAKNKVAELKKSESHTNTQKKDRVVRDKDTQGKPTMFKKKKRRPRPENKNERQSPNNLKKTVKPEKKPKDKNRVNHHSHSDNERSSKGKNKKDNLTDKKETQKKEHRPLRSMKKKTRKKKTKKKKEQPIEEVIVNEVLETSKIMLPVRTTVGEFANIINKPANEIILKLMNLGVMAAINQYIDYETMELITSDFNIEVELKAEEVDQDIVNYDYEDKVEDLVPRAPVVTVMGHVDHGKTSLLDAIRSTNVIGGEAGGITQHIGASEVVVHGQKIVFLDTPGHEAFTSLRARGAQVTDIAILVVAADDGVMPQTIEAIDHARAADVPIIVAVNKIDKPGANPDKVKKELSEHGVLVEDWGGDVVCVHVSALNGENIEQLLEMVLLVAEIRELKANPKRNAVGTVIEANLEKGRGSVATVLIQNGHLKIGDPFVCGTTYGRVRALHNSKGKRVKNVGPSTAVEVIGMNEVPIAGDKFFAIDSDKEARQIAEHRESQIKEEKMSRAGGRVTLEDIFNQIKEGKIKELNLIIKADAHGSLEALRGSLSKLSNSEVKINIQHANIGAITESDIMLATASNTIVLGFNVRPSSMVIALAKKENVEIKTYRIIYELINDVEAAMKGMLDPEFEEVQLGEVEVRATFKVPNAGTIAGGYVISGKVMRNAKIRLLREGIIIHEGELSSLKRFKDDVKEVATGYECGLGIANYNDLKEGDIIEAYNIVEKPRK